MTELQQGIDECVVTEKPQRLFIVDIVNAPASHPTNKDAIEFHNLHIKKVHVCGVVTSCWNTKSKTLFTLDDGTGSIVCALNYDRYLKHVGRLDQIKARMKVLSQTTSDHAETESLKVSIQVK